MGTNQMTPGTDEQYCRHCRAVVSNAAVRCPECDADLEGPSPTGSAGTGGTTGGDAGLLLVGVSAISAVLSAGSFLLGFLFGPFVLGSLLFSSLGAVPGFLAYRRYDSTAGLLVGTVNALAFLAGVALVVLVVLVLLGIVAIGLTGGALVPVVAPVPI